MQSSSVTEGDCDSSMQPLLSNPSNSPSITVLCQSYPCCSFLVQSQQLPKPPGRIRELLDSLTGACSGWKQCKCPAGSDRNRVWIHISRACFQIPFFLPLQKSPLSSQLLEVLEVVLISLSQGISLRSQSRSLSQVRGEMYDWVFSPQYKFHSCDHKTQLLLIDTSAGGVEVTIKKVQLFWPGNE